MKTLQDLIEAREGKLKEMKTVLETADNEEKRDLTSEEETRYTALDAEVDALTKDIERAKKLDEQERQHKLDQKTVVNPLNQRGVVTIEPAHDEAEFKSMDEFMESVTHNPQDERLAGLFTDFRSAEGRAQSMGIGSKGGFAIPKQFHSSIFSVEPGEAIFRPRAQIIPAGSPPDSSIEIPTLDQTAAENIYAGMTMDWISEGGDKTETDMNMKLVELAPKELAGTVVTTDKLLRNAPAFSGMITGIMRKALIGAEETAFYNGNGVGKPLGILNSPARIEYTRAGANAITYADVVGMFARLKMGGSPVWIASQTIIPQLMSMVDPGSGGTVIWQPSAVVGMPGTLFGIPLMFHERSVGLGSTGDLILADLSYYLVKDGSGPFVAMSDQVFFRSNKTVFKIFTNVDAQPWLSAPIPIEGSTSDTVSPFIVLKSA